MEYTNPVQNCAIYLPKNYNVTFSITLRKWEKQDKHLLKGRNWRLHPHSSRNALREISRQKLRSENKRLWRESGRTYETKPKPLVSANHPATSGHQNLHICLRTNTYFPPKYSKKQPGTFTWMITLYHWPPPPLFLLQLSLFIPTQIQTEGALAQRKHDTQA